MEVFYKSNVVSDIRPNISADYFRLFLTADFYPCQHKFESNLEIFFFYQNFTKRELNTEDLLGTYFSSNRQQKHDAPPNQ